MSAEQFGFDPADMELQRPQDNRVLELYESYGLPPEPSMKAVEPVAKELWAKGQRMTAAELVLARQLEPDELQRDEFLAAVMGTKDPEDAFIGLIFWKEYSEVAATKQHAEL